MTGEPYEWNVATEGGAVRWQGYTGPLRLHEDELARACRRLLGVPRGRLQQVASEHVATGAAPSDDTPRLILHSTTPGIRAFEADLAAMLEGRVPLDLTTYTETRALYLGRPGDLAVGRTRPWRSAVAGAEADGLALEDADHYYLSHALLRRALDRGSADPALERIIAYLRENPRCVVSLYSFEPELQVLLSWLAREAGVERIPVDANDPMLAATWNRKGVLHPTVEAALARDSECRGLDARRLLEIEHRSSEAFRTLHQPIPVTPGYTIPACSRRETFVAGLLRAGELLRARHGLSRGCLKPSEGGDGARIVPGIDLEDRTRLEQLAASGWALGGDYLLEAHVDYLGLDIDDERLYTTPSTHLSAGRLLDDLTLQFMRGASWKGNVYVDETGWCSLGLDPVDHARVRSVAASLGDRLRRRGLIRAGFDFAVGRVGGSFGDSVIVAVQDINIKMTGAMFLREFMERHRTSDPLDAATRVFLPRFGATCRAVEARLAAWAGSDRVHELIAVVPGRWGMLATTGASPAEAVAQALSLERRLIDEGLAVEPPTETPSS